MVRRLAVVLAAVGLVMVAGVARADPRGGLSPMGRWLTQDREGVIEISACGTGLCGRIVGMDSPAHADGQPVLDVNGVPQCGLTIMQVAADGSGRWNGQIIDPDTGRAWRCALWVNEPDRLNLRGYVLIPALGQMQSWTRFAGMPAADCRF